MALPFQNNLTHTFQSLPLILLMCCIFVNSGHSQQIIVRYIAEQKITPAYMPDGSIFDSPAQIYQATLRATPSASVWSLDSLMFRRLGFYGEGFQLFVSGLWQFRDKTNGKILQHTLYYGKNEFAEFPLADSNNASHEDCGKWEIDPQQSKKILGIECMKARRTCHDGEHLAYFTRSIPIVDGPAYIPSLPGLILSFEDDEYIYTAQRIDANENELVPPAVIHLIRKDRYSPADSRVVAGKKNLIPNVWIDLLSYYMIE